MADSTIPAPPASVTPTVPDSPKVIGLPTVWVKGGTTSYSYDMQIKAAEADAEKRRNELDDDRAAAAAGVAVTGTKLHSHDLMDPKTSPKVLLHLVNERKEDLALILADVVLSDNVDGEMSLIWPCPDCMARGLPQGQAQNRASNKVRAWFLDTKKAGEPIRWVDAFTGHTEWYVSAGEVVDTDILKCPGYGCSMAVRIHKNMMYRV